MIARPETAALGALQEAGVTRAVFMIPSAGRDEVLPILDDLSRAAR